MAAPVMGDDAIALLHEVEQLRIPVVAAQGPAVMQDDSLTRAPVLIEDLNAILCVDRAHRFRSFAWVRRKKGWLSGHLGCESIRPSSRDGGDHATSVCDGGGAPVERAPFPVPTPSHQALLLDHPSAGSVPTLPPAWCSPAVARRITSWAAGNARCGARRQGPPTGRGCRQVGTGADRGRHVGTADGV